MAFKTNAGFLLVRPAVGSVSRRLRKTDKNGNPRLSLQFSGEHATFLFKLVDCLEKCLIYGHI
ncbi:MAG: hypothetical protein ACLS83_00900, partial [Oscillospiraceae bacterium]